MHAGENAEEIAVERRGVWDTGISEQRGKHRSESDPEDHGSGEARRARPVKLFDESANDEGRILRLLPRQHAEDACLHGKIQDGDADYGNEDAAGNIARRIADFPRFLKRNRAGTFSDDRARLHRFFQIASSLTTLSTSNVVLAGGASSCTS